MEVEKMKKVTLLKKTIDDIEFSLPHGWKKIGRKRKDKDHWDFYLITSDNKKFRSNAEVKRYTENNPNVKCDLSVTNTQFNDSLKNLEMPEPKKEPKTISFIKTKANTIMPKLLLSPKNGPSSSQSAKYKDKSPKQLRKKPEVEEEPPPNDDNSDSSDSDEGLRVPDFMKKLNPERQIVNKLSPFVKLKSLPDSISSKYLGSNYDNIGSGSDFSDSHEGLRVPDFMKELKPARQIINKLSPIVKLEPLPDAMSSKYLGSNDDNIGSKSDSSYSDEGSRVSDFMEESPTVKLKPLPDSMPNKKPRFETCGGIKFKKIDIGEDEVRKSGRSRKIPARLRDWSIDSDSELSPKKTRKALKEKSEGVNLNLFNCDDVVEYSLPFGWKKVCKKRKNSDTRNWDVYIINSDGKKFRSTVEVERHLSQNPNEDCDLSVTNTILPIELREQKSFLNKEDETNIIGKKKPSKVSAYGMISMASTAMESDSSDQESDYDNYNSDPGNLLKDIDNCSGGLDLEYKFFLLP